VCSSDLLIPAKPEYSAPRALAIGISECIPVPSHENPGLLREAPNAARSGPVSEIRTIRSGMTRCRLCIGASRNAEMPDPRSGVSCRTEMPALSNAKSDNPTRAGNVSIHAGAIHAAIDVKHAHHVVPGQILERTANLQRVVAGFPRLAR